MTLMPVSNISMLVDCSSNFGGSRWIDLTGVSGHPGSSHYTDQADLWARGETLPWAFTADAVEAAAEELVEPVAIAPCKLYELLRLCDERAAFWCPEHGDAAASSELQETLLS